MWIYEKKLQYPVKIKNPNPKLASIVMAQLGGPDGELGAATRYLQQRYSMPYDQVKAILTDVGTEELAHIEMISAIMHQLTKGLSEEEIRTNGFDTYFVDHTDGVYPQGANGVPFSTSTIQVTGDVLADLYEDLAAEQKARVSYDNLLRMIDDPDVLDPLRFLREREIVHFQRFGDALRVAQDNLDSKNFYAFNPAFDTKCNPPQKRTCVKDTCNCPDAPVDDCCVTYDTCNKKDPCNMPKTDCCKTPVYENNISKDNDMNNCFYPLDHKENLYAVPACHIKRGGDDMNMNTNQPIANSNMANAPKMDNNMKPPIMPLKENSKLPKMDNNVKPPIMPLQDHYKMSNMDMNRKPPIMPFTDNSKMPKMDNNMNSSIMPFTENCKMPKMDNNMNPPIMPFTDNSKMPKMDNNMNPSIMPFMENSKMPKMDNNMNPPIMPFMENSKMPKMDNNMNPPMMPMKENSNTLKWKSL